MAEKIEGFEAGEDVTEEFVRGKPHGIVVSVRLSNKDADKLVDLAECSGRTVSQLARQAIQAFLARGGQPLALRYGVQATSDRNLTVHAPGWSELSIGPLFTVSTVDSEPVTTLGRR